jgi:CheY-like chemotaxis protein
MASILIVDDDRDSSEALGRFLEKAGHVVRRVPNGRDALAQVILHQPDVVVLDLFMPCMDGASFLDVVRSYLRLQALPVVVLTAIPDSPMVDRVRYLKVNSILAKGKATLDQILRAVEEAVYRIPGA